MRVDNRLLRRSWSITKFSSFNDVPNLVTKSINFCCLRKIRIGRDVKLIPLWTKRIHHPLSGKLSCIIHRPRKTCSLIWTVQSLLSRHITTGVLRMHKRDFRRTHTDLS